MTNENKEFSQSYFEKKSLVEKILSLPEGFSLEENEDFLKLRFKDETKDEIIGTYSTNGVTSEKLREDIEETIEKHQKGELVNPDIKI